MIAPMQNSSLKKLTVASMMLALGFVLPLLTGQLPEIGRMLLPMHIPVFLSALLCGAGYAVPMAAVLPILRSLLFSVPALYPDAVAIACELATYALSAGVLYKRLPLPKLPRIYLSLLPAQLLGRVVRLLCQLFLLGLQGVSLSLRGFLFGVILTSLPGILLQLVLIPATMVILEKTKLI